MAKKWLERVGKRPFISRKFLLSVSTYTYTYMLLYCYNGLLQGDEMPEPKSMLEATSEANNLASLSEAKETYMRGMEEVCGAERPYINEHVLEIEHLRIHDTALEVFNSRRKMGGEEFSTKYREKLESEIQETFENLKVRLLAICIKYDK